MKTTPLSSLSFAAALALILAPASMDAAIVSYDIGGNAGSATSPVEDGFTAFNFADGAGPNTVTAGGITGIVTAGTTLAGATLKDVNGDFSSVQTVIHRDRGIPAADTGVFTYSQLYRDFATAAFMGIEIKGLTASTPYLVTFYAYDNSGSRTQTFTNVTDGATAPVGTVTYTLGFTFNAATPNSIFSTTFTSTSDAQGRLFFTESGTGAGGSSNVAVLNGIEVAAVPEPTTAALGALGGLGMLGLLRRRRLSSYLKVGC